MKTTATKQTETWKNTVFESSSVKTKQFKSFSRFFKSTLRANLNEDQEIITFNSNHFYISGFIKDNNRTVYFSISDVRFFINDWFNHILIRTAKDTKDFTGGNNCYTSLTNIGNSISNI